MRLIDADRAIKHYKALANIRHNEMCAPVSWAHAFNEFILYLEEAPTVDAAEVVRCKDCKHWHEETGWCNEHSHFIGAEGEACHPWESNDWKMLDADDFCSYGERKEK